jgi:hypothetical protein
MKNLFFIIAFLACLGLQAQDFKQTVKGRVVDGQSQSPIAGVLVEVLDSGNHVLGIDSTDDKGYYSIPSIPTGRIGIRIVTMSYMEYSLFNIIHNSGKETVLDVELFEKVNELKGAGVKAKRNLNNSNISLSAKSFDIEDTRRYAGSRNDPARMASNFAGVVGNNDSRNDIIIRGNSPQGLLWRMEGIDIPNPNHFGAMGASGGPVTILNNNVLAKSDFITSAFPAMYGNATAGVFDLQMRSGNKGKREYTGQIGFNGFEAGAEGPLKKSNKSSYLVNYRYSTLAFLQRLGMNFGTGTAVPYYQDITFKVDLPIKRHKLSVFGIGGLSHIHFTNNDSKDSTNFYSNGNQDLKYRTKMAVAGLSYTHFIGSNMYLKTSVGTTYTSVKTIVDSVGQNASFGIYRDNSSTYRLILNSMFNKKINAQNNFSIGINAQDIGFNFNDSVRYNNGFKALRSDNGNTWLLQLYALYQYKFNSRTTLNSGLHGQVLTLNGSYAVEPRLGLVHQLSRKKKLSLGAGMHSQMQNMQVYFLKTVVNGVEYQTNKDLGFTKSIHTVLAYDYVISKTWRSKVEAYYQHLYQVPVTAYPSYYSVINEGADFNTPNTDSLVNDGTGRNYGIEFTLEKTFDRGFYMLNTLSVYQSKYTGSNGIEKNTAFNGNFILNVLAGKEVVFSKKSTLAFDTKVSVAGGRRYTPIHIELSKLLHKQVNIESETYDKQFDPYFRLDFKISYRRSGKKISQEWFVDIQNITNRKNIFVQGFNAQTGEINRQYQLGLFPNFNYRVNF